MNRRLYRSHADSVISGVAGGVAEYLDVDPAIVRVLWALLALITGGVFLIIYIVMWIVVPYGPESEGATGSGQDAPEPAPSDATAASTWNAQPPRRPRLGGSGGGSGIFGLVLVVVGLYFLAREYLPDLDFDRLWPIGLVLLGLFLLVSALRRRPA